MDLLREIDAERKRVAVHAGQDLAEPVEPVEPPRYTREPRSPIGSGPMRAALWQRAVRERQRLSGDNPRAAEDVVTSVINHLGHLDRRAGWFAANARLREAAIDETLRRALLGVPVPSEPAQRAWDRYWSEHLTWLRVDPQTAERLAQARARETLADDRLRAWSNWAATA